MREIFYKKKESNQNKVCSVCGNINNVQSKFCDFCGSPLETGSERSSFKEQRPLEIALGYASSIQEEKEQRDGLVVLDMAACFGQESHRRILCVIVKGVETLVKSKNIVDSLLSDILQSKAGSSNHQIRFAEIQKQLYQEFSHAVLSGEVKKETETGVLVNLLDYRQLMSVCIGSPCTFILNKNGFKEIMKGTRTDLSVQSKIVEDGDYICICCNDITKFIEKKEVLETVLKAENPQIACNELLRKTLQKKPDIDFSIVVAQIIGS